MFLAARAGVRRTSLLLAIGLGASGLVAIFAFWAFYASPTLGRSFGYLVAFGSLGIVVVSLWGRRIEVELLRELAVPLALWALASAFVVYLGFLHGGTADPLGMSTTRFSSQL